VQDRLYALAEGRHRVRRKARCGGAQVPAWAGVGCNILDDCTATDAIKYVFVGILHRERLVDPNSGQYLVDIIDEVLERSIARDVLLRLFKEANWTSSSPSTPPLSTRRSAHFMK